MTDNEIIKSLECCSNGEASCKECSYYNKTAHCVDRLTNDTLDLINRQQAEIERLQKHNLVVARKHYDDGIKEFSKRLKDVWFDNRYDSPSIDFDYFVDNLVEEMTEVTENDL